MQSTLGNKYQLGIEYSELANEGSSRESEKSNFGAIARRNAQEGVTNQIFVGVMERIIRA